MVREGIRAILESEPGFHIVGLAQNGQEVLTLLETEPCHLVLLDIRMPELDGISTCRLLKERYPHIHAAMLTNYIDEEEIVGSIQAGASGYLLKDVPADELISSLQRLARNEPVMSGFALQVLLDRIRTQSTPRGHRFEQAHLTSREEQILAAMVQGNSNTLIAEQFGLAEGTVRNHVSRIYEKLGVRDRIELMMLARQQGWYFRS